MRVQECTNSLGSQVAADGQEAAVTGRWWPTKSLDPLAAAVVATAAVLVAAVVAATVVAAG